jgi:lipopolysaccharide export system protein LptC
MSDQSGLPRGALATEGARRSATIAAALALLAVATQVLLWLTREPPPPDRFIGPPRSDYELEQFTLVALDEAGKRAFTVISPRLARHPHLGTLTIDTPEFAIADPAGDWSASARSGWVSADGKELRLTGAVKADRPANANGAAVALRTEALTARTDTRTLSSERAVTLTQSGSILRGTGFEAALATDRFAFASEFRARHVPAPSR